MESILRTCLSKICAIKVQEGIVEIEEIEEDILIDNSVEEYTNKVKEAVKVAKKSLIKLNCSENKNKQYSIDIDTQNPIYDAIKLTPISELDYII